MPKPPKPSPIVIQGQQAPPNPPMFGEGAPQRKQQKKSMIPSFLGAEMTPSASQRGGNTLLGQA